MAFVLNLFVSRRYSAYGCQIPLDEKEFLFVQKMIQKAAPAVTPSCFGSITIQMVVLHPHLRCVALRPQRPKGQSST